MTLVRPDGRRVRGERARQALLEACLCVIERDGIAAVTHRKVTSEAGLPATSAAYHFQSINDLLEQSLLYADAQAATALNDCATAADPIRALAEWLVSDFTDERSRVIAEFELFLYAARVPEMRKSAGRWLNDLNALVSTWTDRPGAARTICAYIDGLLLQALVSGECPDPKRLEATIRNLL